MSPFQKIIFFSITLVLFLFLLWKFFLQEIRSEYSFSMQSTTKELSEEQALYNETAKEIIHQDITPSSKQEVKTSVNIQNTENQSKDINKFIEELNLNSYKAPELFFRNKYMNIQSLNPEYLMKLDITEIEEIKNHIKDFGILEKTPSGDFTLAKKQ